jgi:hypothetical protein
MNHSQYSKRNNNRQKLINLIATTPATGITTRPGKSADEVTRLTAERFAKGGEG